MTTNDLIKGLELIAEVNMYETVYRTSYICLEAAKKIKELTEDVEVQRQMYQSAIAGQRTLQGAFAGKV